MAASVEGHDRAVENQSCRDVKVPTRQGRADMNGMRRTDDTKRHGGKKKKPRRHVGVCQPPMLRPSLAGSFSAARQTRRTPQRRPPTSVVLSRFQAASRPSGTAPRPADPSLLLSPPREWACRRPATSQRLSRTLQQPACGSAQSWPTARPHGPSPSLPPSTAQQALWPLVVGGWLAALADGIGNHRAMGGPWPTNQRRTARPSPLARVVAVARSISSASRSRPAASLALSSGPSSGLSSGL